MEATGTPIDHFTEITTATPQTITEEEEVQITA